MALAITVNLICFGPMSSMIDLATGGGTIEEATSAEAMDVAADIAREGMVLLKNDGGLLPLANGSGLNLFGWSSTNPVYGGTGSGSLNDAYHTVSILESLENAGFQVNSDLTDFYTGYRAERATVGMWDQDWTLPEPGADQYSDALISGAKDFSDVAMVVISRPGGENADLPADMAAVLYPFDHGLSYTTFEYSDLKVSDKEATFTLTNTGSIKRSFSTWTESFVSLTSSTIRRGKPWPTGWVSTSMRRSTTGFDPTALGKVEANFCLGNGYLGLRSATEEKYLGETRFYDKNYLQFTPKTIQSGITFVIDATHRFTVNGEAVEPKSDINILRRRMFSKFSLSVETGQLIKVWSGFIEIHITADVVYGVWQYYMCTGDQDFMDKYGYELMLDCAKFWSSRLEPGEDGKLDGKLGLLLNQGAATVCSPRLDFVDLSVILRNSSRKRPILLRAIP